MFTTTLSHADAAAAKCRNLTSLASASRVALGLQRPFVERMDEGGFWRSFDFNFGLWLWTLDFGSSGGGGGNHWTLDFGLWILDPILGRSFSGLDFGLCTLDFGLG